MSEKANVLWHCTNPSCRSELPVESDRQFESTRPRCHCGALMKKHYTPPCVTYVEFLRPDSHALTPQDSLKE